MVSIFLTLSSSYAAAVSLVTDKYCALAEGDDRYNMNSSVKDFTKKFGAADSEENTTFGDKPGFVVLTCKTEGITVSYRKSDKKIVQFMFDLRVDDTFEINSKVQFVAGNRQLSKVLGAPKSSNEFVTQFKQPGCTIGVVNSIAGSPILAIINSLEEKF